MTPGSDLVVRPARGGAPDRRRRWLYLALPPLLAWFFWRIHAALSLGNAFLFVGILAAVGAAAFVSRRWFFEGASLTVGSRLVRRTGYFGRAASCERAAIARVLVTTPIPSRSAKVEIPVQWLLFLDRADRVLIRVYAEYYTDEDLSRVRRALRVEWETDEERRTYAEMRRRFPGSFPWPMAHPYLLGLAVILALSAVVLVVQALA